MADKRCFANIRSKIPVEKIGDEELTKIIDDVQNRKVNSDPKSLKKQLDKLKLDRVTFLTLQTDTKVKKLIARKSIKTALATPEAESLVRKGKYTEIAEASLEGSSGKWVGSKFSFRSLQRSVEALYAKAFNHSFSADIEVRKIIQNPEMDEEVITATYLLRMGDSKFDQYPESIKKTAMAVNKMNDLIVDNLKAAGVNVNRRLDYVMRQTHDGVLIRKASFDTWKTDIKDFLDPEETFGTDDLKKQNEILRDIYDSITTNNYGTESNALIGRRSLHFKDGESLAKYNSKYGTGSLLENIQQSIRAAATVESSHRVFGPDRKDYFDTLDKEIEAAITKVHGVNAPAELDKFRDTDMFAFQKHRREASRIQTFSPGSAGSTDKLAVKVFGATRAIQAMAKLGLSAASTIADFANASNRMLSLTNSFSSIGKLIENYTRVLSPTAKKEFADKLSFILDSELSLRFDELSGMQRLDTASRLSMEAFGLGWTTRQNRLTMTLTIAGDLAERMKKGSFTDMEPRIKSELKSFGISEAEWVQASAAIENVRGIEILSTDKLLKTVSKDTYYKFASLLNHNGWFGAIEAGGIARGRLLGKSTADTTWGQAVRASMQFKSYAVEAVRASKEILNQNPETYNMSLLKRFQDADSLKLIGWMGASFTGTAVASMWLKDLANGKTPRDMTNPENIMQALLMGPVPLEMQYLVNTFSGQYGRGRSVLKDLAGPTFSTALDDFPRAMSELLEGKTAGFERLIRSQIPGNTMPVVSPIIRKYILDGINEGGNSQYNRQVEERLQEQNQRYIHPFFDPRE